MTVTIELISKLLGLVSALAAVFCLAVASSVRADEVHPWLDREAKRLITGEYAGAIAVGWIDGGKTGFANYGETAIDNGRLPDADTVFEIGSMTKVFTGVLLADMVARKQVALDDPVAKYLPAGVKVPTYKGHTISLLDLATQSSGLPRLPDNLTPKDPADPYADYTPQRLYAFLSGYKLTRAPGAQYEYSNLGMGLLAHALALYAGTSYEALIVNRICRPLGMTSTAITLNPELRARLAQGYADGSPANNWNFDALAGAGAFRSTVKDLMRFAAVNLGNPGQDPGALSSTLDASRLPRRSADGGMHIGLAWHVLSGGKIWWHNGGTGGYRSFMALDPAAKRAVVVMASSNSDEMDRVGLAMMKLLAGESAAPLELRPLALVAPELLEKYVGRYELAPAFILTVTRHGNLLAAQATGQGSLRIFPASETEFYYRAVDAQISFVKNVKGEVEKLILHQNGRDTPAKKLP